MGMTAVFFNLLINSAFSLAAGLLAVLFFIWFFRIEMGPWKLFLLSLPFFKIVFDCVRGLPAESVLYTGIDPFNLPPRHQIFSLGAGFSEWGPSFSLIFSVQDVNGKEYAASVGDYLAIGLHRIGGDQILGWIVVFIGVVSFGLVARRIRGLVKFERGRRRDRRQALPLRTEKVLHRPVDIYISEKFLGTPFTGGLWFPYICLPRKAFEKLSEAEREAVISHELGHIRQLDLLVNLFIQFLGDLFWFIPGYRALSRKIDRLREIVADQWAVHSGQNPVVLASALVKLKEVPSTAENFVLYSAFFREKSLLKIRVERLLEKSTESRGRFGWQNRWLRFVVSFWILCAVLLTTLGGNHDAHAVQDIKMLDDVLRYLGWMK